MKVSATLVPETAPIKAMKIKEKCERHTKTVYIEDVIEPARIRSQSFAKVYPEAAQMWAYKLNCGFGPEDFSYGSAVFCWFKCRIAKDHVFQVPIYSMGRAVQTDSDTMGCGFCRGLRISTSNNLQKKFPHLAEEWMTRKNKLKPDMVPYGSNLKAWWKCAKGHTWEAVIANRTTNDSGCPNCNLGAPTDLRMYPTVLKDYDWDNNPGIDPYSLPVGVKVNWVCKFNESHRWKSGFYRTTKKERCPYCANRAASNQNSLKSMYPKLAKQWHPRGNKGKEPQDVTAGSHFKAWWRCDEGPDHEWQATVSDRVGDASGCPFCSFRRTSITNVISTQAPHLVKEWHPKNGKVKPDDERTHSRTNRWWKCQKCSHVWQATPYSRVVRRSGCKRCALEISVAIMNYNKRELKKKQRG